MPDQLSTQELIERVQRASRRQAIAFGVFMASIGLALGFVLILQYQTLQSYNIQAEQSAKDNKILQEYIKNQTQRTNKILICIGQYFSDPDRAKTVITNIEDCNIDQTVGLVDHSPQIVKPPEQDNSLAYSSGNTGPAQSSGGNDNPGIPGVSSNKPNPGIVTPPPPTTPQRTFLQENLTDPLLNTVNDLRGRIGL